LSNVTQLSSGAWQISHPFRGENEVIGSYLLAGGNELAVIDPGPGSAVESLLASIREAGFDPEDVTHLIATHVHLDHAGGTGTLVKQMPGAQVYVHRKGAPHLVDTAKVVASASRIFGDRMQLLWGEIESTPQERLHILDVHSGELFAGDVAGVRLPGIDYIRPPTPPPDLDIEAWSDSIDLVKRLRPDVLYIGHFGAVKHDLPEHLERLRTKLYSWGDFVLGAMRDGKSEPEITTMLIEHTEPELLQAAGGDRRALDRYEIATNYQMTVQGYMRYWRKKHPERL